MVQKKKVFMSFALATNTSLLLMDEPTNGLDIPGKSQFRKFIASGMSDERTIVISTHQVRDIDRIPVSYTHLDVYKRQVLEDESFLKNILLMLSNHENLLVQGRTKLYYSDQDPYYAIVGCDYYIFTLRRILI